MEQFQADLLKSVKDMKAGRTARTTQVEPTVAALDRVSADQLTTITSLGFRKEVLIDLPRVD